MTQRIDRPAEDHFPAGLAAPARRALASAGYTRLEQLAGVKESEIAKLHGLGPRGVALLKDALAARGLAFAGQEGRSGNVQED